MTEIIGKSLFDAIEMILDSNDKDKIIEVEKLLGTNKRFNDLENPYVIKVKKNENYIKLFVTYY